jgi:hypothetical protein
MVGRIACQTWASSGAPSQPGSSSHAIHAAARTSSTSGRGEQGPSVLLLHRVEVGAGPHHRQRLGNAPVRAPDRAADHLAVAARGGEPGPEPYPHQFGRGDQGGGPERLLRRHPVDQAARPAVVGQGQFPDELGELTVVVIGPAVRGAFGQSLGEHEQQALVGGTGKRASARLDFAHGGIHSRKKRKRANPEKGGQGQIHGTAQASTAERGRAYGMVFRIASLTLP